MRFFYFFAVFFLLIFGGCSDGDSISADNISAKTKEMIQTDFDLKSSNGQTFHAKVTDKGISFSGTEGKAVILDFFATWCPPCRAEAPHLVHLQDKYKDSVIILGMQMEKDASAPDNLEKFQDEFEINYPVIVGAEVQGLAKSLGGIPSIPYMVIYDANATYVNHYIGAVPEEMLEQDILKATGK